MQSLKNRLKTYVNYIRYKGVRSSLLLLLNAVMERLWFISHRSSGLSVMDFNRQEKSLDNQEHSTFYVPTPVIPFLKLIKKLQLPKDSVFVDYGAGKGRAMILAAESRSFKKIKGVEFNTHLHKTAEKNILSYVQKTNKNVFQLMHKDVVKYQVQPEDNVFYFFNPFNEHILKQCMNRIHTSLKINPRPAFLIYQSYLQDKTKCITEDGVFSLLFPFISMACQFYVYKFCPSNYKSG